MKIKLVHKPSKYRLGVFPSEYREDDLALISMLEDDKHFQKKVARIRNQHAIPKDGFNFDEIDFKQYTIDNQFDYYGFIDKNAKSKSRKPVASFETYASVSESMKEYHLHSRWDVPIWFFFCFGSLPSPKTPLFQVRKGGDMTSKIIGNKDSRNILSVISPSSTHIILAGKTTKRQFLKFTDKWWDEIEDRLTKEDFKPLPNRADIELHKFIYNLKEKGFTYKKIAKEVNKKEQSNSYDEDQVKRKYHYYTNTMIPALRSGNKTAK